MFAYYDRDADIAWFPTGKSDDVVSERVSGGLRDYDRTTREFIAIEVWDASTCLPQILLEALPSPSEPHSAAAATSAQKRAPQDSRAARRLPK